METKTITIPLDEYNKLVSENQRMKKALRNRDLIAFEWKQYSMGMGCTINTWNIATKDEFVLKLHDFLKKCQDDLHEAWEENWKLKQEKATIERKKWWQF